MTASPTVHSLPEARPRILHIITRLDAGGAATNTLRSVASLPEHGFNVALLYGLTSDSAAATLRCDRANTIYTPSIVRHVAPFRDLYAFFRILRLLKTEHFDLVHTHCSKAGALGRLAAFALGIPTVHTAHGHIFYGYFGWIPTKIFIAIERRLSWRTNRLVSLTAIETEESLERGIGHRHQYSTVPSGVPLKHFQTLEDGTGADFRRRHGIPPDAFVFLSAGRLVPIKGFDLLLAGLAELTKKSKNAVLLVAGDGEERERLKRLTAEMGIETHVRFAGHCEDMRPALSAADAFVLASRNEGQGRVFVEAMAAGLPVIGPRVGGIPALVTHGKTGLLLEDHSPEAIATAMRTLLCDRTGASRLAKQGMESVFPDYDEATMVERLADIYRDVLNEVSEKTGKSLTA